MEAGGRAWWWLQVGSEKEVCRWRRWGLWVWTALYAQWLHCRGRGCSDLGAHGSQATVGWDHR